MAELCGLRPLKYGDLVEIPWPVRTARGRVLDMRGYPGNERVLVEVLDVDVDEPWTIMYPLRQVRRLPADQATGTQKLPVRADVVHAKPARPGSLTSAHVILITSGAGIRERRHADRRLNVGER
jgi:hypothetical protein